jgi:hypothetical protein
MSSLAATAHEAFVLEAAHGVEISEAAAWAPALSLQRIDIFSASDGPSIRDDENQ